MAGRTKRYIKKVQGVSGLGTITLKEVNEAVSVAGTSWFDRVVLYEMQPGGKLVEVEPVFRCSLVEKRGD